MSREDDAVKGDGCASLLIVLLLPMLLGVVLAMSSKLGDIKKRLDAIEKALAAKESHK